MFKCHKCGEAVDAVFRANEKGVAGVFHCRGCFTGLIPPEVDDVVRAIEDGNSRG